jgi:hypothetical protein
MSGEHNPFDSPQNLADSDQDLSREHPGIRRLPYFALTTLTAIMYRIAPLGLGDADSGQLLVSVVELASAGLCMWIVVQRLINIGLNRWWVVGLIVPLLNIWVVLQCLAAPEGYAQHRSFDTAGRLVIKLFFWSIVVAILLNVWLR